MKKNIAVVGCGAWGMNLICNFHELGTLSEVCDSNKMRLDLIKEKYPDVITYKEFGTKITMMQ